MATDEGVCAECGNAGPGACFSERDAYVIVCADCLNKALDELGE